MFFVSLVLPKEQSIPTTTSNFKQLQQHKKMKTTVWALSDWSKRQCHSKNTNNKVTLSLFVARILWCQQETATKEYQRSIYLLLLVLCSQGCLLSSYCERERSRNTIVALLQRMMSCWLDEGSRSQRAAPTAPAIAVQLSFVLQNRLNLWTAYLRDRCSIIGKALQIMQQRSRK